MMEKLGISVTNADGSMKDSVQIQKELHDSFSTLSESEQIAAASAIFGKNQMAPWLALINTAPGDVDALSAALNQNGPAMEMQAAIIDAAVGFGCIARKYDVPHVAFSLSDTHAVLYRGEDFCLNILW